MRLLLLEANAGDAERIEAEVRRAGLMVEVWVAANRAEFIDALRADGWAAVLAADDLPDITAGEALRTVRERKADLPFIIVAGRDGDDDVAAVAAIRAGANDYVCKERLGRLAPAIERELRAVHLRQERNAFFEALRRSEERYRRMFEQAPAGVAVSTPAGEAIMANERFLTIFGLDAADARTRSLWDVTGLAPSAWADEVSSRRTQTFRRADGSVVHASVSVAPVRGDRGEIRQMVWLVEDVTAQVAAEEELQKRAMQQSALSGLSRVALGSRSDETFAAACATVELCTGATEVSLHDRSAEVPPDGLPRFDAGVAAVPVGSASSPFAVLVARASPERPFTRGEFDFMQSVAAILAEAGERDRAAAALAASEQRYREVVEGASEIIFTATSEGILTAANAAFESVTGWPVEEWIGRPVLDLVPRGGRQGAAGALREAMTTRKALTRDLPILTRGGAMRIVEVTSIPKIVDGRTTAIHGFARDVTEARQAEEERRERLKLEAKLEQAQRLSSLGRIAATIAHEFNNVLMGIAPFVEIIRRGKDVPLAVDQISRTIQRGKRVTQEILRFTQHAEPVRTAIDVARWMENLAVEARTLLPPGIHLTASPPEPGLRIDGDANQLLQVFVNLVLNARDAMPHGGTLTIAVTRERPGTRFPFGAVEQPERYAHFIVRDTGSGMAPDTLRHIFEPLFTTKRNGTGLGLAVAHQVVMRHGGEMFVESAPDRGTAFHVFLPLGSAGAPAEAADDTPAPPALAALRVLLVEDDETVAAGIASLLELEGISVSVANSGSEAVRMVRVEVPDVVILDVGLPDIDGLAVYRAIAALHPRLPVIFSTGHADGSRLDALEPTSPVAFLLKPYDSAALLDAIRRVSSPPEAPSANAS